MESPKRIRGWLRDFVLATLPSLVMLLVVAEGFFRLVVPAAQAPTVAYDSAAGFRHQDPLGQRDGVWTIGKFAQQRGRWHINNAGWNSEVDYDDPPVRTRPLVAIIGDSFVEAFQVDVDRSFPAVLRRLAGDKYEVYSFGLSGTPLSHYRQVALYVDRRYHPDVLVFNVVHNDFDESVKDLVDLPLVHQIRRHGVGFEEVPAIPYTASPFRRLVLRSAFFRYLWWNLNLSVSVQLRGAHTGNFDANVDVDKTARERPMIVQATHYLVQKIREEHPGKSILYVMDAPRRDVYQQRLGQSEVLWLNATLAEACARYQSAYLDLTAVFSEAYRKQHTRFETQYDSHWNELGHRVVAEALYSRLAKLIPAWSASAGSQSPARAAPDEVRLP